MAYQALYRKYRPTTFSEVVGQEHITETLKNELASGKIVHAYLFTGTRGTGKTSCAKILAKAVNCLQPQNGDPCLACDSCLAVANGENTDIVEIDAASNNSVDSIRDLRDRVNFAPSSSKYRVYIIDEVHMLTISAFNALLKTLEEPPAHVIFILATTEVHKLPATILSRCQRFDFKRIEAEKICAHIQDIAEKEGLTVTPGAARLIAAAADGGMRDALSILDLCASGNREITEDTVEHVCGMAGDDHVGRLADAIKQGDAQSALLLLDKLYASSVDMQRLLSELTMHYRDLMIMKTVKTGERPIVCSASRMKVLEQQAADYDIRDILYTLSLLQATAPAMQTGNRRCEMEMTLIKLCNPALVSDITALEKRVRRLETGMPPATATAATTAPEPKAASDLPPTMPDGNIDDDDDEIPLPEAPPEEAPVNAVPHKAVPEPSGDVTPVSEWGEIISVLKTTCPLMAGVLQDSQGYLKGGYLLIDAKNDQFRSLINGGNPYYRDSIRKAAQSVLGATYKLGPYSAAAAAKEESDPLRVLAERLKLAQKD